MDASIAAAFAAGLAARGETGENTPAPPTEPVAPSLLNQIETSTDRHYGARVDALGHAVRHHNEGGDAKGIVATAEAFLAFLTGKAAA